MIEEGIKNFGLEMGNRHLSSQGIEDYYWPIRTDEMSALRSQCRQALSELLIETRTKDPDGFLIIKVLVLGILNLLMQMLHASLLQARFQRCDQQVKSSQSYPYLTMLQKNEMARTPELIALLKRGPIPLKKITLPLRFGRDVVKGFSEGIVRRRLWGIDFDKDIIALASHGLVREWKEHAQKRVTFLRTNTWFQPVTQCTGTLNKKEGLLINQLKTLLSQMYSSFDVVVPDIFKQYYEKFLQEGFLYVMHHLNTARSTHKIPMHLWGNTGGSVWMRLLSALVQEKGGQVTGFDHAGGSGYFQNLGDYRLKEFLVCDRFVTFSKKQAELMQEDCKAFPELLSPAPEFLFAQGQRKKKIPSEIKKDSPIKTIMLVAPIYPSERIGTNSDFMSDVMLLDWQVRLLSWLQGRGYNVQLKPHPECPVQPPQALQELLGPIVQDGLFEAVYSKADLLIFDSISSTTFRAAILSGKPMVFINFDLCQIRPEAMQLLQQRCAVVKGYFDQANRANVDWEQLQHGLVSARSKRDNAFEQHYFC